METRPFSDSEVSALAQVERQMDAGKTQFVLCPLGQRWAFPQALLEPLGVISGQRVSNVILDQLLVRHVAYLATLVAIDKASGTTKG